MGEDPPDGIKIRDPKEEDRFQEWIAEMSGPEDTPYKGGKFFIRIQFPEKYPFEAPKVKILTKMLHPGVDKDGIICLDTLKDNWSPANNVAGILKEIRQTLLTQPPQRIVTNSEMRVPKWSKNTPWRKTHHSDV